MGACVCVRVCVSPPSSHKHKHTQTLSPFPSQARTDFSFPCPQSTNILLCCVMLNSGVDRRTILCRVGCVGGTGRQEKSEHRLPNSTNTLHVHTLETHSKHTRNTLETHTHEHTHTRTHKRHTHSSTHTDNTHNRPATRSWLCIAYVV